MAYSYVLYTGDGSTDTFVVPFDYVNETDITVFVNAVAVTNFSFLTPSTIQFDDAPDNDATIRFQRTTERTDLEVVFQDGSTLTAAEENRAFKQVFFLAQEFLDVASAVDVAEAEVDFGVYSAIPSPGTENRLYVSTDTFQIFRDNGVSWELLEGALTGKVTKPAGSSTTTLTPLVAADFAANAVETAAIKDLNVTLGKLAAVVQAALVPTGTVQDFAGSSAPTGYVLCDGTAYSSLSATYIPLYNVIGTTFGVGGANTFKVPDCSGRATIGVGTGATLTARALADAVGAETHTLGLTEIPSHAHTLAAGSSGGVLPIPDWSDVTCAANDREQTSSSVGGGLAHNNMQPSIALNKIIKL